ncbi:hypothetical protein PISL3812_07228 [Talaromyces islandicus]|uniref:SP-RING-type domain-containing protein n=1 Tax=Talaromyces islandicus TaxID=28573 RepID=A0A0U1M3P7_TALIS|nr:hypothetical protein PISL3812_07228 [Talaromyces islandicus]
MSPAQHSPGRPRQRSGNELATSNSTANRFLGTAQRSWMTNGTASAPVLVPKKSPAQTSKPGVLTNLPSTTPTIPPLSGFITAPQPDPKVNGGPPLDSVNITPSDLPTVFYDAPVSPITPGARFPDSTADRGPGAVDALSPKKVEPAKVDPPRQLPVLPSPEPSNDSRPSPTAIPKASYQSTAVPPVLSTLAKPRPVPGGGMAPTAPAITQPRPASTLHSQSPSGSVSSLPRTGPVASARPAASPSPDPIWKHAINRLKILQEKSAEQHSLSETVELPRLRILEDACHAQDMFYLALHQVYCIVSFAPSQLASLRPFGIEPDTGLNVIKQLLVDNQRLSGDFLKWCVSYPSPLLSMLELEEYKTALSQVANCLSNISKHWLVFEQDLRTRAYPPQVDELVDRLGVISPTLQSIIFTALSRRLFGPRDQLLKACTSLFERDKSTYKMRQTYDKDQRQKEALSYSLQYMHLCASHGVFSNANNNTHNKSNTVAPTPAPPPNPAQAPTPTTAPQPKPNLPQSPIYQQGQHPPPFPPYQQPPMAHYVSPVLPRPDCVPFMSTPQNSALRQGQQFSYPPPPQFSPPLSNPAQNNPQHQANSPQVPHIATSRQDVRQGPTPNNSVPTSQVQSRDLESGSHRGPKPKAGPAGQARVGPPAYHPNPHTSAQSYTGSTFVMTYSSPLPMAQGMPAPAAYSQSAMLPSHSTPQPVITQMTQMAIPSQLGSRPSTKQPLQASPTPFSPHLTPNVLASSAPTMPQGNNGHFQLVAGAKLPPTLVHYFSDFAMPATKLTPNRSAFKFPFQVSSEALQRRPRLATQAGSHILVPCFSDGDMSYRLRCIKYEGHLNIDSLPVWSRAENAWPDVVYIHINNKEVHRPHNSKNMPIDINRFLESGTNEIRLNVLHNAQQRTRNVTYAIAVEVLRFTKPAGFRSLIKTLPSRESLQQIQNRLGVNNDDDDLMIMDNYISVDLRDPFSTRIFDTPIRGVNCEHRDCFDLSTFLQTITFTPSAIGKRTPYLRCPICRKDIRPHLLIIDEFLLEVRASLAQQQKSETAKSIRVKSDGSWEAVLETEDDNKTPSKKLKRDRASFESDLFKTEASRENSLSRIPETVEVIELD